MSVVGLGIPGIVASHVAEVGAVGGRYITVLRGPQPVDARSVSIPLVESLVLSVSHGAYCRRGVAGFRGPVTKFGCSVSGIRRVDQLAQPFLAAL